MKIRAIKLELLRPGPAHNQLLSPLTPYLALAGNRDAETLRVGYEHADAMDRLRALRYEEGDRAARRARAELAAEMGRLFGGLQGLLAELSSSPQGDGRIVQIRLVLSASELALLPFEIADTPRGFPGEGQPFGVQGVMKVAITREVRRASGAPPLRWPERPRILVVAASPPEVGDVPLAAHLVALAEALAPWLVTRDRAGLEAYITVIERASLAAVKAACDATAFTHVHILAHGYATRDPAHGERMYGLAFHASDDPGVIDVANGVKLAAALGCRVDEGHASPAVVTIASCDSANVGSVAIATGGGVAHDLHAAGVPLVFASQFPLSKRGSVVMAEAIYGRLFAGDDPRAVVYAMRQALYVTCPDTHDWASVTVYASLPDDVEAQVEAARFTGARRAVEAAMARLDDALRRKVDPPAWRRNRASLAKAMQRLDASPAMDGGADERLSAHGLLAGAKKRYARTLFNRPLWPLLREPERGTARADVDAAFVAASSSSSSRDAEPTPVEAQRASREALRQARDHYEAAYRINASEAWTLVQSLACTVALDAPELTASPAQRRRLEERWTGALVLARDSLEGHGRRPAWGYGALVELHVLATALLPEGHEARRDGEARAFELVEELLVQSVHPLDPYSVRRELERYARWWWADRPELRALPERLATWLDEHGVPAVFSDLL